MPLSLIGTFFMMLALGYSINLLTLLALVLAIGLVVDDAIIVVENFDRHLKAGESPLDSALFAARELGGPILAMTVVLVAAYLPIGFQGGLTGALFTQFAFTLAAAVSVSAVIALTLSPMLCSKLFRADHEEGRFAKQVDKNFNRVRHFYQRVLSEWLVTWQVLVGLGAAILCLTIYLFATADSELAPSEDQGVVVAQIKGAPNATYQQMEVYSKQMFDAASSLPEYYGVFQRVGGNTGFGGVLFQPWGDRKRNATQLQEVLQERWGHIAGAQIAAFQLPSLPGSSGLPLQFVITTTEPLQNLYEVTQTLLARAKANGMFFFIDSDMKIDKPQATLGLDRELVGDMGLTQQSVGASLGAALGGGYVNYFSIAAAPTR